MYCKVVIQNEYTEVIYRSEDGAHNWCYKEPMNLKKKTVKH